MAHIEMFPEYIQELQKELVQHPDIQAKMDATMSFETNIALICTELNILVDGLYDAPDIVNMVIRKLKDRRAIIIGVY